MQRGRGLGCFRLQHALHDLGIGPSQAPGNSPVQVVLMVGQCHGDQPLNHGFTLVPDCGQAEIDGIVPNVTHLIPGQGHGQCNGIGPLRVRAPDIAIAHHPGQRASNPMVRVLGASDQGLQE